jgi:hypothetical protein
MLKLKTDGYIYHLLENYGSRNPYYINNLCDVVKGLMQAMIVICLMITVALAFSIVSFAWIIPLLVHGFSWEALVNENIFTLSFTLFVFICLFVLAAWGDSKIAEARRVRSEDDKVSLIAAWYDGFKNKYCPRVEFVDKYEDV